MHAQILSSVMVAALFPFSTAVQPATRGEVSASAQDPAVNPKAEYEKRKKEAEGSVEKLWKLYDWCETSGLKTESRSTLRAILKLDPEEKQAHDLLGHVFFDGKWFDSDKKVEEYKKKQLEAEAKASGKVVYKGALVDPADVPFLEKGMTKDATGKWVDLETQKKIAEGWVRQDLTWIPPAEAENVAKGLWKCGDKWMSLDEANKFHSDVGKWWTIANDRFILYSTCTRKLTELALQNCDLAHRDLVRLYGKTPALAVPVILLNSEAQYNSFATGDEAGFAQVEGSGRSSVKGAFIADALVSFTTSGQTLPGVAYWSTADERSNKFGEMFVRHAAAQSYAEALDPSPKTMAKVGKGDSGNAYSENFWAEKQLPQWFRYGGASYAERFLRDSTVAAGGDPFWRKVWAVENITNKGGLDPLDRIFKFEIGPDSRDASEKLINESGLLIAFALDGKCVDVQTKLGALKEAIKVNKDIPKAAQALAEEIKKNESKLRIWANL